MSDLIAYLKNLGRDRVPGVTDSQIRVATIVPGSGSGAAIGKQMAAVLSGLLTDAGEVHGRRLQLDVVEVRPESDAVQKQLETTLAAHVPFAFVGGIVTGVEEAVEGVVDSARIPLVLPVGSANDAPSGDHLRFYAHPGTAGQVMALLRFAMGTMEPPAKRVVILARDESVALARRAAEGVDGGKAVTVVDTGAADAAESLAATLTDSVALISLDRRFTTREFAAITRQRAMSTPLLFVSGSLPEDIFRTSLPNRLFVALTTPPQVMTAGGLNEYREFATRHQIKGEHWAAQLSAYVAGKVFLDAVKKSGRQLTRHSLKTSLESLYQFETGLSPPLSFGRGRHVGSSTIYISRIDPSTKGLTPVGEISIDGSSSDRQ